MAEVLFGAGADVDTRIVNWKVQHKGETPLHWAGSSDDAKMVEVLVKAGLTSTAMEGPSATAHPYPRP
jgi:ankyrin repeat protein